MSMPRARLKVVTMNEDDGTETKWVLAGWQEAYRADLGGIVYLTLQNGGVIRDEVISALDFNSWYPLWPTLDFVCTGIQVDEVPRGRNSLDPQGFR